MKLFRLLLHPLPRIPTGMLLAVWLCSPTGVLGQSPVGAGTDRTTLPDTPQPKPQEHLNPAREATYRVVGYVTNRSIVFPDIAHSEGPLSVGGKFQLFVNQSVSPPYIIAPALGAAYNQARNVPVAYGQGWDAYGSRFGEAWARGASESFLSTAVLASAFHQDPRFFPQYHPSLRSSAGYAARRLFFTRTDSGRDTFNSSGILGNLAAESLANVYLPASEQTAPKTLGRFATDLAWRFVGNMFRNYWPTLFHDMGLNRLKVIPDPKLESNPAPPNRPQ